MGEAKKRKDKEGRYKSYLGDDYKEKQVHKQWVRFWKEAEKKEKGGKK